MVKVDSDGDRDSDRMAFRWGGDDGDGVGKLTVTASADGYAGHSAAWFDRGTVLEFADAIRAYPLPDQPIALSSGFGAKAGQPAQEHVGLRVAPVGGKGQVGIWAHLATERWPDTRPDSVHEVTLELLTTYERLRFLSDHLRLLVDGTFEVAEIEGERLA